MSDQIRLTQFSHGGGCGCKIAPNVLEEILQTNLVTPNEGKLLVGNQSKDDAAVYDLGNGTALISTTDFFMPIVDDAFDFGRIASANAISDVYAMGGKPILAIAILGWPVGKISPDEAKKVIEGSRSICLEAGIPLAGGHSIDSPEPIFGLAVSGLVNIGDLKMNNTAREGDLLFLTKPLGVGILATAQKRDALSDDHYRAMIKQLTTLNKMGEQLGKIKGVSAMTDVTGFGLMGHSIEMAEGSNLSAVLYYDSIVLTDGARQYLSQGIMPGATKRNWESYRSRVAFDDAVDQSEATNLLPDPQTNGGLLIAVNPSAISEVTDLFLTNGLEQFIKPIGCLTAKKIVLFTSVGNYIEPDRISFMRSNFTTKMKTASIIILIICCSGIVQAQPLEDLLKPGSRLLYRMDVGEKHYDLEATILKVFPFEFKWRIADSLKAQGIIRNTQKGMERGTVFCTDFSGDERTLSDNTTSLLLSKLLYRKAIKKRKKVVVQLKEDGEKIRIGVAGKHQPFRLNFNGSPMAIAQHSLKPVVKMGRKYIPTGTEELAVYASRHFPILLKVRGDFYLELLEIKTD